MIIAVCYGIIITLSLLRSKPYTDEIFMASLIRDHGGLWGGFSYWFNNFSSMPVKDFMQFLLVGMPNAYLDWDYANIISLLLPLSVMSLAIIYIIASASTMKVTLPKAILVFLIVVFGFIIAPTFGVEIFKYFDLTENNSSYYYWKFVNISWLWSAVSVTYTLPIALFILIFAYFFKNPNMKYKYVYLLFAGMFIGFGNSNTTVIICSMLFSLLVFNKYFEKISKINWKSIAFLLVAISVSFSSTFFFAGNIKRKSESNHIIAAYDETFFSGMLKDAAFLLSPGFYLVPLAVGTIIFYVIKFRNPASAKPMSVLLPSAFLFSGVLAFTLNNLIAIVLYKSLWHQMNPEVLLIIAGILFGYKIAEIISHKVEYQKFSLTINVAVLIVIIMSAVNVYSLSNYIVKRSDSWWNQYSTHISCGDVPYFWNYKVYETLGKYRDVPTVKLEAVYSSTCDATNMFTS